MGKKMTIEQAIEGLNKILGRLFKFREREASALLNFILNQHESMHPELFTHLVTKYGLVIKGGERDSKTSYSSESKKSKWNRMMVESRPKCEEIHRKIMEADVQPEPEVVGRMVMEAVKSERDKTRRYALLARLFMGEYKYSFIPYVKLSDAALKAKETPIEEKLRHDPIIDEAVERIRAIRMSPVYSNSLLEAAGIQDVLNGIENPVKRAIAGAISYVDLGMPRVLSTEINIVGVPPGMADGLNEIIGKVEKVREDLAGRGLFRGGLFGGFGSPTEGPDEE
jgi:hypothetical protein